MKYLLSLTFACTILSSYGQDNLLKRKINYTAQKQPLEDVLQQVANRGHFTFSYDASIFSSDTEVSIASANQQVKSALDQILNDDIDYRVSGNHLILLKKGAEKNKEKYTIEGTVLNAINNTPLKHVVVYEVSSLVSAVTDEEGAFTMNVPAEFQQLGLSFNKKAVEDTVIFLAPQDHNISISLQPAREAVKARSLEAAPLGATSVESVSIVRQLVPYEARVRTENMNRIRQRKGQVSFLPMLGTNLKMSGLIENNFSLNVLIGYAYGSRVLEVGGLFNIIRKDVEGVQIGGIANMVGGDTKGVQVGGIFNHNKGSMEGFQIAGINNMLIDTLRGIQIAGINNIMKGGMKGAQIAGINNLTTRSVDGIQIAGLTNVAHEDVEKMQMAGLFNKARNVNGFQFGGLINIAQHDVKGFQLAGLINKAQNVGAFQFAGIGNIAKDTVTGMQLAGVFNYAKFVRSNQIGLVNIVDSAVGIPIGLFSYVKKGYRKLELSGNEIIPLNLSFKTGVRKFYNIFSAGYGSWNGKKRWSVGYGLGTERLLGDCTFLGLEYSSHWINEGDSFQKDLSLLNRIGANFGYRNPGGIGITCGPVVNILLSEWRDIETGEYLTDIAPYTLLDDELGSSLFQVWIGGRIAVQF